MTSCLFCRIARGEVPAEIVFEDSDFLAFLDYRPVFKGHTLLIPREHRETLADLPASLNAAFMDRAKRLSTAVETATGAQGTFLAINNKVSQSVPHLHLHIVPRKKGDGLRGFFWPRGRYASDEELHQTGAAIRAALS